jgi:S1-C subfamily serine protease
MRSRHLLTLFLSLSALAATAADVNLDQPQPKAPPHTPVSLDGFKPELRLRFTNWTTSIPANDIVGQVRRGVFCSDPAPVRYTKKLDDWFSHALAKAFNERTLALHYSAPEPPKSVFETQTPGSGADLRAGATLLAWDWRTCGREEYKGESYAKVRWEIFSARQQRVVYTATVESSHSSGDYVKPAEFDQAFLRATVDGLLSDPRVAELVRTGATAAEPAPTLAPLALGTGQVVEGGVAKSGPGLLEAVVTVESGNVSGSAFYISQDGYLLANQHVVGEARFVRVKLAEGRSLVGEVVRIDRERDVALVRTDPVTRGVLALRAEAPRIGEDVYALGSPFGEVLSGTLTHGVLSSRRVLDGVAYLQSDVAVNPGNSGGPLIDSQGRVLGITRIHTNAQGINLFIPIEDAVEKLSLVLGPAAQKK